MGGEHGKEKEDREDADQEREDDDAAEEVACLGIDRRQVIGHRPVITVREFDQQ